MDTAFFPDGSIIDKRNNTYVFSSMSDLKKYFSLYLDRKQIHEVVQVAKQNFVVRKGVSEEETELQFINKCEVGLLKLIRTGP